MSKAIQLALIAALPLALWLAPATTSAQQTATQTATAAGKTVVQKAVVTARAATVACNGTWGMPYPGVPRSTTSCLEPSGASNNAATSAGSCTGTNALSPRSLLASALTMCVLPPGVEEVALRLVVGLELGRVDEVGDGDNRFVDTVFAHLVG